jgi:predicted PurR-regulated permease PerM
MKKENVFFVVTILAAVVLAFLLVVPLWNYLLIAFLLAYLLNPVRIWLQKRISNRSLSAFVLILAILLLIILPAVFFASMLIQEIRTGLSFVAETSGGYDVLGRLEAYFRQWTGRSVDLHMYKNVLLHQVRDYLLRAAPNVVGSVAGMALGLPIMFFVLYYLFKGTGRNIERVRNLIPLAPNLKDQLINEVRNVTSAVVYGQVMTAIVQGTLGGLGFLIFGVASPIFWGTVMILLSFLPLLGTAIVWGPACVYLLLSGETFRGIALLVYNVVVVANVDNFLKPRLISGKSNIHPTTVLLGVFGGLGLFGFLGLFLGPLILALLITLIRFYEEEYLKEQAPLEGTPGASVE